MLRYFFPLFCCFFACYNCKLAFNFFRGILQNFILLWLYWQLLVGLFLFFALLTFFLLLLGQRFIEIDLIEFFEEVVGLIASEGLLLVLVHRVLFLEVALLLPDDGDEVVEVLVEVDALGVIQPELVAAEVFYLLWVAPGPQVRAGILDRLPEGGPVDNSQKVDELLALLLGSRGRGGEDGFELVDDEAGGAALRGVVEGEEVDWVLEALELVDEADAGAGVLPAVLLAEKEHSQDELLVEVLLGGPEVKVVGAEVDLLGDDGPFGGEVRGDVDAAVEVLDGVDDDLGVEDVGGAVDGGDAAEGLRDVADAVVDVEVGDLAVDSAGLDELAELLDEAAEGVEGAGEGGDGAVVVVLVVADDIGEIVHDLAVLLDQPLEEGQEGLLQLLLELRVQLLLDVPEALVELPRRVVVLGQPQQPVVDLDQLVQAHQQRLLLQQRELPRLEDLALRERYGAELALVEVQDVVNQVEVHVLVHVRVLQALAGEARREEEVGLDVDVEAAVPVGRHALLEVRRVALRLPLRRPEAVHALGGRPRGQLVQLLQRHRLQRGPVGLLRVDDQPRLALRLRLVRRDQALLQSRPEDHVLGRALLLGQRERQLIVEIVLLHRNSDLLIGSIIAAQPSRQSGAGGRGENARGDAAGLQRQWII